MSEISDLANELDRYARSIGIRIENGEGSDIFSQSAKRLRSMEEALKPFALIAEHDIGSNEADADIYHMMSAKNARAPLPKVGDFRRAANVLDPLKASLESQLRTYAEGGKAPDGLVDLRGRK